jgi:hypothetical protein
MQTATILCMTKMKSYWLLRSPAAENVLKTAPLVVALLAKASSLGVVARLDWRGLKHVLNRALTI